MFKLIILKKNQIIVIIKLKKYNLNNNQNLLLWIIQKMIKTKIKVRIALLMDTFLKMKINNKNIVKII